MTLKERQKVSVSGFAAIDSPTQSDEKIKQQQTSADKNPFSVEEESKEEPRMQQATVLMQRVPNNFQLLTEQRKPGEELHIEDIIEKTPENETPRMAKRKYESSEKPAQDDRTPKNQAIKLAGSPYDQSSEGSTVRSRKAQKSKLLNHMSPVTQPQAIIGEGIISNNNDESIIGEGLASANTYGDDLARADFMGTVKAIQFNEEVDLQAMANSMPLPDPSYQTTELAQADGHTLSEGVNQEEFQNSHTYEDFHDEFLHNHISTIEEDFEGENLTSEFSTQRT